ncbi:MAG: hypothetical protein HY924_06865 [Elusimicrobia bacterium]|nr:hypothetical protein [Elusimicrobiota bacterium]
MPSSRPPSPDRGVCVRRLFEPRGEPLVMGIVNVAEDSFSRAAQAV